MKDRYRTSTLLISILLISSTLLAGTVPDRVQAEPAGQSFNGQKAYASVQTQMAFGTRIPESEGHANCIHYIVSTLKGYGLEVQYQNFTGDKGDGQDVKFKNVIGILKANITTDTTVFLGAHFDTRPFTDRDITKAPVEPDYDNPIPGANDAGSGVGVLIELARVMRQYNRTKNIKFFFFDGEDYGTDIHSMLYGSTYYASKMSKAELDSTDYLVLFDMIGDRELTIYREKNSDPTLMDRIWSKAESLGNSQFINTTRYTIIDDHIPFRDRGMKVVDLIDFDYPNVTVNYWHTTADTLDKVSSVSLEAVGTTAEAFLVDDLVYKPVVNNTNGNNTTNGPKPPKPPEKKGFIPFVTLPIIMASVAMSIALRRSRKG
jgi:hypothetical protein